MADDFRGDGRAADDLVEMEQILAGEERLDRLGRSGGRFQDDGDFVGLGQVVDLDVEHEAVELGLGQRVGAFHFDGVLGRQNEERLLERVARAGGGDLVLLHGLEQSGLGLRRRAVDLVGEHDVGEERTFHEDERAALGSPR